MWVSVLRAKVKLVARVVEVGRIRVTDQRAPREPVPGKSLRRLRRGPWVSSRARIASKTRARCTRLSACLLVFLPSFVLFLPSFVFFFLPFAPLRLSFASDHLEFSFPSLEHFCPSPFRIVLPFPSLLLSFVYRACTAFHPLPLFHALRFLPHFGLSSLLASPSSSLLSSFSLFSSHPSHRSFLSLVHSLLVPLPMYPFATYLPDYLVLGTGYSVLSTRYPVYSPTTTIGEHTTAEQRHPEATAFVPFVLVRLLLLLQASWEILRLFVSVSRRNAWGQDTLRTHALYSSLLPFSSSVYSCFSSSHLLLLLLRVIVSS